MSTAPIFDSSVAQIQATPDGAGAAVRFHLYSYVLGLLTALILVGGSVYLLRRVEPPPVAIQPPPSPTPLPTATAVPTPGPITVFLSGAVQQPGLLVLPPTARIGDAIAAAGGLLPAANPALVNQAERLYDGAQVHIPEPGAAPAPEAAPVPGLSGLLPTPTPSAAGGERSTAPGSLIDLNLATQEELDSLPGVGESKAAAIIANRPYTSVDDLERVPGFGASTIERLRPLVVVQPRP
jgi:competence protein ComEA